MSFALSLNGDPGDSHEVTAAEFPVQFELVQQRLADHPKEDPVISLLAHRLAHYQRQTF